MPAKNLRVLVMEPANQQLQIDTARPNGALGPAYLVGALRQKGIEADYFDATVGSASAPLSATFYNRIEQDNGTVRYGASPAHMAELFSGYDLIATSSIFTAQTRMHFEAARIAKEVARDRGRALPVISGGVNARALHRLFLQNGFDMIALGEGEETILKIVAELERPAPDFSRVPGIAFRENDRVVTNACATSAMRSMDELPPPALGALPLDRYCELGIPHAGVIERGVKFASLQTSRGCQDICSFCHISLEKRQTDLLGKIGFLRMFSKQRVAEDVDRAVMLGVKRLYFEDDNLFFNKRRLVELDSVLRRDGLEYSNVNGANLRFLFRKDGNGRQVVDTEFIELLAGFGLRELVLPLESRNPAMMNEHASGKYDPDAMDSAALVRALKKAGIRIAGNFMIGFRDEPWESVLRTKEFARQLLREGLDAVGFMIPVPYPGSLDFELVMQDPAAKASFAADPLRYTDQMHWRARPLFPTLVPGERLEAAVREFWLELNNESYTARKLAQNVAAVPSTAEVH
jgi:radical SAM superfamily enzyme YgiQ (UPF0313 family)